MKNREAAAAGGLHLVLGEGTATLVVIANGIQSKALTVTIK